MRYNVNNNTFYGNTISSLAAGIVINGTTPKASPIKETRFNTFTNDTIITCTTGCASNYQDIVLTANVTDITFLNVSFNKSRVAFVARDLSNPVEINNLTVKWFLDVNVTNISNNRPIANAQVVINNSLSINVFTGNTDVTGGIPTLIVTEYTQNGSVDFATSDTCVGINNVNITCFTPHNITVNLTGYNTSFFNITINRSKFVNISMGIAPPPPPDTTPPTISITLDDTTPGFDQIVNVTATVSDAGSNVDTCNFFMNQTSDGSFIILNKTVTGSSDECSQNFTISLVEGDVINFTVIVNDTSTETIGGNKAQDEQIITIGSETKVLGCRNLGQSINYSLTKNVTSSGTCFIIKANDITLDCKGFEIKYSQSVRGYGVNISSQNYTTIKSCDIVQVGIANKDSYGVYIYRNSSNNKVFNNSITTIASESYGVYLLQETYNNSVYNNTITTSGLVGIGVFLDTNVYENSIYNNTLTTGSLVAEGVKISDGHDNSIHSNTISSGDGTASHGISLVLVSKNNSIYGNTITAIGTGADGLHLNSAHNNSVYDNIITVVGGVAHGVALINPAGNNLIFNNNITVNGDSVNGIDAAAAYENFIFNNIITITTPDSAGIRLNNDAYQTFIYNNTIVTNNETSHGIYLLMMILCFYRKYCCWHYLINKFHKN